MLAPIIVALPITVSMHSRPDAAESVRRTDCGRQIYRPLSASTSVLDRLFGLGVEPVQAPCQVLTPAPPPFGHKWVGKRKKGRREFPKESSRWPLLPPFNHFSSSPQRRGRKGKPHKRAHGATGPRRSRGRCWRIPR